MDKKVIATKKAPAAVGPYSQAIRANGFLFVSGQLGIDPAAGKLVEGVEAQAEQALDNMGAILSEAGMGFGSVVKATVLLASMDDFALVNAIYAKRFPENPPARAAFAVVKLPLG
ncbi:MAG: Rid family detoxifying hydrolase, partial [Proteobacteria bacterium]|nr:Rid family detoxifying hydrolase [Pseudomonadota bacterium]